jgi:NAD-dependent histone deacetylase SIR2
MGTSLTVHPFASLAGMVKESCPRVLINLDHVGDFGSRADDVILLGKCDEIVTELCKELTWEKELLRLWEQTEASVLKFEDDGPKETVPVQETTNKQQEPDKLKDVTAKMAQLVVDAAEREGTVSASKPSESKLAALNQAEIPDKASTEKASSSPDLQDTTPRNEQKVSPKETKPNEVSTSPADGKL